MTWITIPERQKVRLDFLFEHATSILRFSGLQYTSRHLKQTIYYSFSKVFFPDPLETGQLDEIADPDDPSNLAIVLLDVLKHYGLKHHVTESLPERKDGVIRLAVLKKGNCCKGVEIRYIIIRGQPGQHKRNH